MLSGQVGQFQMQRNQILAGSQKIRRIQPFQINYCVQHKVSSAQQHQRTTSSLKVCCSTKDDLPSVEQVDPKDIRQAETQLLQRGSFTLLDIRPFRQNWNVPWSYKEFVLGILLWVAVFAAVNFSLPLALLKYWPSADGIPVEYISSLVLMQQITLTVAGISVVRYALKEHLAYADRFVFCCPIKPIYGNNGWGTWATQGMVVCILSVLLYTLIGDQTGAFDVFKDKGYRTVEGLARIMQPNLTSYTLTVFTSSILAPILEEYIYRGFIQTSLSAYMKPWQAVIVQAILFGMSHLTIQDFPQLTMLGIVIGFSFLRTKNLLCPIIIHSIWNLGSTSVIFLFMQQGQLDALFDLAY